MVNIDYVENMVSLERGVIIRNLNDSFSNASKYNFFYVQANVAGNYESANEHLAKSIEQGEKAIEFAKRLGYIDSKEDIFDNFYEKLWRLIG